MMIDFLEVVLRVVSGVAGAVALLVLAIPKLGSLLVERLLASSLERYKKELQQELENHKTELAKKLEDYRAALAKELESHKAALQAELIESQRQKAEADAREKERIRAEADHKLDRLETILADLRGTIADLCDAHEKTFHAASRFLDRMSIMSFAGISYCEIHIQRIDEECQRPAIFTDGKFCENLKALFTAFAIATNEEIARIRSGHR